MRMAKLGDIRKIGSGNIGATNVLRTGNKKVAALTLLCDMLKGTIVILVIKFLNNPIENDVVIFLLVFCFFGASFPCLA